MEEGNELQFHVIIWLSLMNATTMSGFSLIFHWIDWFKSNWVSVILFWPRVESTRNVGACSEANIQFRTAPGLASAGCDGVFLFLSLCLFILPRAVKPQLRGTSNEYPLLMVFKLKKKKLIDINSYQSNRIKGWKMNKPKRFHFDCFLFESFDCQI